MQTLQFIVTGNEGLKFRAIVYINGEGFFDDAYIIENWGEKVVCFLVKIKR